MKDGRKIVFIVDDEPTNLTIAANALSDHYNVFTFNSSANLMKRLEKQIPDVILLDVEMPDMNGYETIKKLKENDKTKDIPVIFVTARSDTDSEFMGLSLGAIDYIIKPFLPPLLHKRIEIHLLVESQKEELRDFNNNLQMYLSNKLHIDDMRNGRLRIQYYFAYDANAPIEEAYHVEEIDGNNYGSIQQDDTAWAISVSVSYMFTWQWAMFFNPESSGGYFDGAETYEYSGSGYLIINTIWIEE